MFVFFNEEWNAKQKEQEEGSDRGREVFSRRISSACEKKDASKETRG